MRSGRILGMWAALALAACSSNGNPAPGNPPGAAPTVTGVTPQSGFDAGGTAVTITGTGFLNAGATAVAFGATAAGNVVVVDDTTITATTPAFAGFGATAVTVTNDNGPGALADAFTFVRFPPMPRADAQIDAEGNPADVPTPFGFPQICCEGGRIYAVWTEDIAGTGNQDVFFQVSSDGGQTWAPQALRVDTDGLGAANSVIPRICCDGDRVYVCWSDNRSGTFEVFFNRSIDGGATFLPADIRVSSTAAGAANVFFAAQICCDGDLVALSWTDDRNAAVALTAFDVFANASTDGGLTFLANDVRLNAAAVPGTTPANGLSTTRMCCDGLNVATTWSDRRGADSDVWLNRSTDGGATWLAAAVRVDRGGASNAENPRMWCDGSDIYVGFVDDRNAAVAGTAFDVFVNVSTDGGATFGVADVRVSTAPAGSMTAGNIELCCEGNNVYLTWQDDRNGANTDVFFNRSIDGGATFQPADERINTGVPAASTPRTAVPKICCGANAVHIVWADQRNGLPDIFLNSSADAGVTWLAAPVRLDRDVPNAGESTNPQMCCDGPVAYVLWRDDRRAPATGDFDLFFGATDP